MKSAKDQICRSELTPSPPPRCVLLRSRGGDASRAYSHAQTHGSGEILKGRTIGLMRPASMPLRVGESMQRS